MADHVLHHPKLPDQPITVDVPDGGELSPEYRRMGWREKPASARDRTPIEPSATDDPQAAPVSTEKEI